ncbi:MAG: GTPase ObgE [Thermaerobacter sp.]|nr:GTPase ObgE [Thermaerobacter sp.]
MFVDEVKIYVRGGSGGNGSVAFRREKFVPNGGPAGGDGGRGGDVILVVDSGLNTLMDFRQRRRYEAPDGAAGGNNRRYGKDGEDILVPVPPGTVVTTESGEVVADLTLPGETAVVAQGGRGGKGNVHFVSSVHRAPRVAERGQPGEERWLHLELTLLADVGLVGFPNAGKSTLISRVSAARPKIADYPFTTLVPNLGVVADYGDPFVLADVPGLIEGAHAGSGLGDTFLRHLRRTRLILHLVEMNPQNGREAVSDCRIIEREMAAFSRELAERPTILVATKMDLGGSDQPLRALQQAVAPRLVFPISAVTGQGLADLMWRVRDTLSQIPIVETVRREVALKPIIRGFKVVSDQDGVRLIGDVEDRARMTLWGRREAEAYFAEYLRRRGVPAALRRAGISEGTAVRVADGTLYWREGDLAVE